MKPEPKRFLRISEVVKELNTTRKTFVKNYIEKGLAYIHEGSRIKIDRIDLENFLERNKRQVLTDSLPGK